MVVGDLGEHPNVQTPICHHHQTSHRLHGDSRTGGRRESRACSLLYASVASVLFYCYKDKSSEPVWEVASVSLSFPEMDVFTGPLLSPLRKPPAAATITITIGCHCPLAVDRRLIFTAWQTPHTDPHAGSQEKSTFISSMNL